MGLVFAARRTGIDVDHVHWLLEEDDYQKLLDSEAPSVGDIVLYSHERHGITHIGIILEFKSHPQKPGEFETRVLSKWGAPGAEYIHPIDHVPEDYGEPAEFWRHIRHETRRTDVKDRE